MTKCDATFIWARSRRVVAGYELARGDVIPDEVLTALSKRQQKRYREQGWIECVPAGVAGRWGSDDNSQRGGVV